VHETPISIIELFEYARTHPSILNPLLRLGGIEEEATMNLEDRGVNQYKGRDLVNKVDEVNLYIYHDENLD
jgi:hypothetical protein